VTRETRVGRGAGTGGTSAKGSGLLGGLVLLGLAVCVAGCGRGSDRADARAVTARFLAALERGDGAAACAQLSPATRVTLEDSEQKPCREAVGSLGLQASPVTRLQLYVTNAKADLANGDSVFLSQGAQGWRLSAAGCRPARGKPADAPYDCALEA
jgi:hypothetical protein